MPEAVSDLKSPKTPRRPKTPCEQPDRQVRFEDDNPAARESTKKTKEADTQPTNHPQVGQPPVTNTPSGPWFTSVDPMRSVNAPGQPAGVFATAGAGALPGQQAFFPSPHCHAAFTPPCYPHLTTYLGHHHPHPAMADYQNCVPPPTGVNFQPPVPDSTFGPIPHVYVPRYDGVPGLVGVQVGFAPSPPAYSFNPMPVQYYATPTTTATTTFVVPKTFCVNGYTYHASRHAAETHIHIHSRNTRCRRQIY